MNSANAHAVPAAADLRGHSRVAFVIAVIGAVIASAVVLFVSDTASAVAALILFCALFVVMLWLPALSSIAVGPRIVLALLTLRPLLDIGHSDTPSTAKFPLQGVYAVLFALVLIRAWKKARTSASPIGLPNIIILLLLASVIAAWVIGGLRFGTDGFVRTSWGLLVALLLGPLFTTPRQIDLFIRIVFCSSVLVLLVLAFNLDQGVYFDGLWRLGGQFGVPNALAAVAFSLFGYGLYAFDASATTGERLVHLVLLGLLAIVIAATQSRTAGGLMIMAVGLWLWGRGYRRLMYCMAVAVAVLAVSSVAANWRLTSRLFDPTGNFDLASVDLTGRTLLWGETLQYYLDADLLHKVFGLGFGTVFQNFSFSKLADVSSVTENSFLWFLAGTGVVGLTTFCAYLGLMFVRTWNGWREATSDFDRRLALLGLLTVLVFLIEGFTFDLVLSPVASGYLYAVLSIYACNRMNQRARKTAHAALV